MVHAIDKSFSVTSALLCQSTVFPDVFSSQEGHAPSAGAQEHKGTTLLERECARR